MIFAAPIPSAGVETVPVDTSRVPILIVEDHFETRLIYDRYLKGTHYQTFFSRAASLKHEG